LPFAGHLIAVHLVETRKVRTPECSIAGNTRHSVSAEEDKCSRKYVQVML